MSTASTMTPRLARLEDAPAVTTLVQAAYEQWVAPIGRRPAPMDKDYAALIAEGQVQVVERDDAIVGILVLEDQPGHLWLDNIAVAPAAAGSGLGRALLAFVEDEARRRGYGEVRLLTHQAMLRNIEIYARWGYVETERRIEDGFARVFMTKVL